MCIENYRKYLLIHKDFPLGIVNVNFFGIQAFLYTINLGLLSILK